MVSLSESKEFDSIEQLTLFVKEKLDSLSYEVICAAYLDNENNLIALIELSGGTQNNVDANIEELIAYAFSINCKSIMLYHNHPSGSSVPSESDIVATKRLYRIAFVNGIVLKDHIVVSKSGYHSIFSVSPDITLW